MHSHSFGKGCSWLHHGVRPLRVFQTDVSQTGDRIPDVLLPDERRLDGMNRVEHHPNGNHANQGIFVVKVPDWVFGVCHLPSRPVWRGVSGSSRGIR